MLSTPPATHNSMSPSRMARAACTAASSPLAQSRFKVTPGTSAGSPARSSAIRATFLLSSPAWLAQPKKTSSTSFAAGLRPISSLITSAPRSSGRICDKRPRILPTGVRTASTITASCMKPRFRLHSAHASARRRPGARLHPRRRAARPLPSRLAAGQGGGSSLLSGRFHAGLPAPAPALREAAREAGPDRRRALGHLHRHPRVARAHGKELRALVSLALRRPRSGDPALRRALADGQRAALGVHHRPAGHRPLPPRGAALAQLPERRRHPAGAGRKRAGRPRGAARLIPACCSSRSLEGRCYGAYAEKLDPQPHVCLALGFLKAKPLCPNWPST